MADISIIVPIYNAEKYLNKCLDSLLNQTKKELEFVLINDGSTDKTDSIIKSYNDKRIKYFKNKNQGIGKTRNFGISKSSGKYIMFLDCAAMSGGDVVHFATKEEALPTVREQLRPNTSMLIKASHSMRFERLTEDLRKYYD